MNSRAGSDGHDSFTKSLLANGIASSSSPNISHHYNNGQMKQKSNVRVASAKYHDIAATILRGSRDVEEVFLNTAKNGDLNKLEQLLSQSGSIGLDIDCKDKRTGNTALVWAAKRGHVKAVEALLKHGAEVTLCNHEAQTALETAHSSVRTILLDWVETQTQINERLLLQAAWQGNLSVVRTILTNEKRHPDVNCQSAEGLTPLMLVTRDVQLFERLSAQLNRYYSPVQVAEELIKAKADVSATDSDGRSCLHYISMSKAACAEKLVSVLISGGMAVEVKDKNFFTPIHLASQLGITNNVVALAEGGSDVNVKGFAGSTPLHLTAYNDHQKTASTLLSFGADATLEDDRGLTPMDVAKSKKMKMLLKEAWTEGATKGHHSQLTSNEQNKEMNKKNSIVQKRKPEVIFDDLARSAQNSPVMKPGSAKTRVLSNVEKCKQAEKKILQEVEALKAAHPVFTRETTRILGTSRSKILPQIGRSTSPVLALPAPLPDQVHDLTLEETRQQLLSRGRSISDIKLGYRQSAMSGSVSSDDFVGQFHRGSPLGNDYTQHRISEPEPFSPSLKNLTESCDSILFNTPASLKMKSVTCSSPTSHTSFFMTDKKSNPDDDVFSVTEPHVDFMRCRTIFKEDFILEESRPKDLMSGSDPASSLSSLSTPSPRDAFTNQHFFPKSYKLETLVEQQASNQFLSSPLEIWNNPDLRATRPQIRNPRQKVRHRSDNSLSSSLESENETDKKSKRLTPNAVNIFKKSFSDTSSSSDSVNVHKSQSLESLSPRAHSQPAQKKIVSLSDESINTSSKKSQLAESKRKDIPKLNLSQNNTVIPEIKKFQKQQDIVKPFSGKAKMLISADIDNWDSKSIKLYSVSTKKEKNVSYNLIAESPERNSVTVFDSPKNLLENSDSSTTHKINENSKQPLHNSLSVPDFSSRVTNSGVESYNDNDEVERSYFVVTKEAELISNTLYNKTKKKQEAKVSSVKVNEPPVTPSARKKSADLAANIERTIMRNHKNNPPLTYRNMTDMLKDQAKPGTEVKKSESPVKSNLNSQKPQCSNVKSSKIKQSSPAKSNSSIPQSHGKKNNSGKTTSLDKEGQKDKPKENNTQILAQNTKAAERDNNNSQLGHWDPPHIEVDPPSSQTMQKRIETPITTPLIVDPFEAFPQAHIKLIENSTDAVVKLKKSSTSKTHKKSASSKRPVSGSSRQSSAGKKRPNKGKDKKADNDSRPKSSKRNGKHKQTIVNEELDELYDLAESENIVLVSGIGWQLSTSFIKPPQGGSTEQSLQNNHLLQSTLAESKNYLQAFKEKISENSPRFLEMKQQPSPTESKLPTVDDDGYPPMNLDMTQNYGHKILMENFGNPFYAESLSPGEENALGKLSPITELSLSQTIDNMLEDFTAARNDKSKDEEQIHFHADARQPQKDSSSEHGDQPKQRCSEDDNLDEVIEEILSSTTSSLSSTLRSISSHIKPKPFSGSHTLTYGDHKLLGQMSSLLHDSPFHAQRLSSTINISASEKINKGSNPSNVCSSGDNLATSKSNQTIDNQDNIQLDPKQLETPKIPNITETVGNAIPLPSKPPLSLKKSIGDETSSYVTPLRRSSSTKFQRRRDQNLNEEEAKQLAKVINSFKQMELTTGSGRQDSRNTSIKSPIRKSGSHLAVNEASSNSRPSSMNASFKMKGKFIELKESQVENRKPEAETKNLTGVSNTDDENNPHNEQLSNIKVKIVTEATDDKQNRNEIRRESLTGSEAMSDTMKGVDDTIQWKKGNILGRGAFGTVWCGLTNEGQLIAVKQIELTTIDTSKAHHEYEKVQEEVELLKTLEHTNIVGYLGTSLEDNIVSIFMQFIPGGSLASILARFDALEESVFRRYTKQILEGVKYLHDNDVIHRDLKGANVMLMPNGVIKLIDFGCAKRMCINLSISQVEILKSMKGTPFWMAPEVVNETGHGKKSDIWSIGCTVFEMATRNPPWSDMNPMAAIFAIGSATRPVPTLDEKFSQEARNFVLQCMTRDQEIRPDAASLLQHPFITKKFIRKE